jgi:hypothetical protein
MSIKHTSTIDIVLLFELIHSIH